MGFTGLSFALHINRYCFIEHNSVVGVIVEGHAFTFDIIEASYIYFQGVVLKQKFEVFSYFVAAKMIQSGLRGSAFAGDVLDEFFDAEIGLIFGEIKRGALGKTEQKFIENVSGQVELSHFFLKDLDKC